MNAFVALTVVVNGALGMALAAPSSASKEKVPTIPLSKLAPSGESSAPPKIQETPPAGPRARGPFTGDQAKSADEELETYPSGSAEDMLNMTVTPRDVEEASRRYTSGGSGKKCRTEDGYLLDPEDPEYTDCVKNTVKVPNTPGGS